MMIDLIADFFLQQLMVTVVDRTTISQTVVINHHIQLTLKKNSNDMERSAVSLRQLRFLWGDVTDFCGWLL